MINFAVVDMLAGVSAGINLFYFAGFYYCNLWKWYSYEDWEYYIVFTFEFLFPFASLINITAIALERFQATFWPHRYRVLKKWKYTIIISVVWITVGLLFFASIVLIKFSRPSYSTHLSNSLILICLLIICISYVRIVIIAQPQHHGAASGERKLTMTLLIATVVSLLFYLPGVIFHVVDFANSNSDLVSTYVRLHGFLIFYFIQTRLQIQSYTQHECQTSEELWLLSFVDGPSS